MVNFKQMIGLIILSLGMMLLIYSVRTADLTNGTLLAGAMLAICGIIVSLVMNKKRNLK